MSYQLIERIEDNGTRRYFLRKYEDFDITNAVTPFFDAIEFIPYPEREKFEEKFHRICRSHFAVIRSNGTLERSGALIQLIAEVNAVKKSLTTT